MQKTARLSGITVAGNCRSILALRKKIVWSDAKNRSVVGNCSCRELPLNFGTPEKNSVVRCKKPLGCRELQLPGIAA